MIQDLNIDYLLSKKVICQVLTLLINIFLLSGGDDEGTGRRRPGEPLAGLDG